MLPRLDPTNEAALKLARKAVADHASARGLYVFAANVLAGNCDDRNDVEIALAAILEVTERAAGPADGFVVSGNDQHSAGRDYAARKFATYLRRLEHLS